MPTPIEAPIVVTLVIAPAHMRSTASPGTVCGSPARIATERPRVNPWSPVWLVAAIATSSMRSAGTAALRSIRPMVAFTARSSARVFQYMPFRRRARKGCVLHRRRRRPRSRPLCLQVSAWPQSMKRAKRGGIGWIEPTKRPPGWCRAIAPPLQRRPRSSVQSVQSARGALRGSRVLRRSLPESHREDPMRRDAGTRA